MSVLSFRISSFLIQIEEAAARLTVTDDQAGVVSALCSHSLEQVRLCAPNQLTESILEEMEYLQS
uniref:BLOC-1-related complex subunit 7 n=1 Tax=Ascaris lumbricoides TaxID=6252 RepID=A0A0M3HRU0_ASCLU